MLDRIYELTRRPFYYEVTFHYQNCYGTFMVDCTIILNRPAKLVNSVRSLGATEEESLDKAEKLLTKLLNLPPIYQPSLDKQPYQNGYYREIIDETTEIEFKRIHDKYVVTNIKKKDGEFYILDNPKDIPDYYIFVKDLENGEKFYTWDNVENLSGGWGEAIIKDGKVIKIRPIGIS
jgi:hypothetical protein